MTDKEKLEKIKSLADKMADTAFNMTTNSSLLKKAMDEYHQFIINEYHKEEQIIKELQKEPISEKKCMFTKDNYTDEDRKVLCEDCKEKCEHSKKEEPVSESMNTESMIESYKQRLISQANGMKNSPFIDMCLASYKHGINETLDTLNLSNVERTVKDWKEMPVSKELEEAAKEYANSLSSKCDKTYVAVDFKAGAKWQKEHLWKPADGDDLPEIGREVIALLDNGKVVFAHRPPEYWDGKDIDTGKVTRNYPKTYDKGGWNIPNTKYWLDVELPKEI